LSVAGFFVSAVLKAVSNVNDIIAPALVGKVRGLLCISSQMLYKSPVYNWYW